MDAHLASIDARLIKSLEVQTSLTPVQESWVGDQEVMQQLHWSKSTLQRRRIDGTLPFTKIKGKYYYREADISKMMRSDF